MFRRPSGALAELDAGSSESMERSARDPGTVTERLEPTVRCPVAIGGATPGKQILLPGPLSQAGKYDLDGLHEFGGERDGSGSSFFVFVVRDFCVLEIDVAESDLAEVGPTESKTNTQVEQQDLFLGLTHCKEFRVFHGGQRMFA